MEKPLKKPTDKKLNRELKVPVPTKVDAPKQEKKEEPKTEEKKEAPVKEEAKAEAKPEEKIAEKKEAKPKVKKTEAIARGHDLRASKKHCMYICSFIKHKQIDQAIRELQEVIAMKRAIPFKGEIPHRKGKAMMAGRYPVKVSGQFIYLLKGLKGNVIAGNMDLEKTRIAEASASWASRPQKRGGMRFKRTNVILKAKEITSEAKK